MVAIWMSKCLCEKSIILAFFLVLSDNNEPNSVGGFLRAFVALVYKEEDACLPACQPGQSSNPVHVKAIKLLDCVSKCVVPFKMGTSLSEKKVCLL